IDLGVMKLHVAEACSGLRYLFPILSFSYIFAVLYQGPMWHKAVLLISAAPITILMNSVRIAVAGYIVNNYGVEWVEGFTHFFEGWVIFIACILLLFLLAWVMLLLRKDRVGLIDALDLDTDGLATQAARIGLVRPSRAMVTAAAIGVAAVLAWQAVPDRGAIVVDRQDFTRFPARLGEWTRQGGRQSLDENIAQALGADDYYLADMTRTAAAAPVNVFMAWYYDQSQGGVHSPEICLPGAGWEIAWLERTDMANHMGTTEPFNINRAIIQRGESRMMVYYWFEQKGRRVAWDFAAKFWLLADGVRTGRTDGALVRLTTQILPNETDAEAEDRLRSMLDEVIEPLPRFIPVGADV
ncbi:MAG: VPLPA-CTERM-specific exosortase XrtD, partial [Pseudomonadota bacterium]